MNRINELEALIKKYKLLYYEGSPEINDYEYDQLEEELRSLSPDSRVLNLVGSEVSKEDKVKHDRKMLSLNKTYSKDDLMKWIGENKVVSCFKIDGMSCSLIYRDGQLVLAKTRGDGQYGENILSKVNWIPSIPKLIKENVEIDIRGEIYCTEKNFLELSNMMEKLGLEKPSSKRNIVAGIISRKENIDLARFLSFTAFDVVLDNHYYSELEKQSILRANDFNSLPLREINNMDDVNESIREMVDFMNNGHYLIDGLVFSYDDQNLQKTMGETAHHPRYKMAFKVAGESAHTDILSIEWSVSRNGILTPVANVKPVLLGGAMIGRVTLHNFGNAKNYNLKKGDVIEIIRSGEVIPKFLNVVQSSGGIFTFPLSCPSCESETLVNDIRLICPNLNCVGRIKEDILNFIQKIKIESLNDKRLLELINKKIVSNIPDLYRIKLDDLFQLEKVKEKLANKILAGIEKSKNVNLVTFLSALGLSGGAYGKCEKIVNSGYDSIEKILSLSVEDLKLIEGFAEKSSIDFFESLMSKKQMIKELLDLGVNLSYEEKKIIKSKLTDKKICITGTLSISKKEFEEYLKGYGCDIVKSVSSQTDILISNNFDSTSSKMKKAKQLNIEIYSEQQIKNLLG